MDGFSVVQFLSDDALPFDHEYLPVDAMNHPLGGPNYLSHARLAHASFAPAQPRNWQQLMFNRPNYAVGNIVSSAQMLREPYGGSMALDHSEAHAPAFRAAMRR